MCRCVRRQSVGKVRSPSHKNTAYTHSLWIYSSSAYIHRVSCQPCLQPVKTTDVPKTWCNQVKSFVVQSSSARTTSSKKKKKKSCYMKAEAHLHQCDLRWMKQDNTEKIRETKWEERWEGDKKGLKNDKYSESCNESNDERRSRRREEEREEGEDVCRRGNWIMRKEG